MSALTKELVLGTLNGLAIDKKIRALDYQFARFIAQVEDCPWVILGAAIMSHQSGIGHVCCELKQLANKPLFALTDIEAAMYLKQLPLKKDWPQTLITQLNKSLVVGDNAPLFIHNSRLYLQRYWCFEQQIGRFLQKRSTPGGEHDASASIAQLLSELFATNFEFVFDKLSQLQQQQLPLDTFCGDFLNLRDDLAIDYQDLTAQLAGVNSIEQLKIFCQQISPAQCINWQQVAVAVASYNQFSVISGGPGTGKTTTVTKLLALLVQQNSLNSEATPLKIELVAPTGKAAARLTESINGAVAKLAVSDDIKALIPTSASTIHRLLGVIPKRSDYKHNKDNPLHLDVLIVDEASMIDISLMAKLLSAIAPRSKVILLGDKDQLASVEAGAVFADICQGLSGGPNFDVVMSEWLQSQTGFKINELVAGAHEVSQPSIIANGLSLLQKSYRFGQHSGIGALAKAVNDGDVKALKEVWQQGYQDINLHTLNDSAQAHIVQMSINGYQDYLKASQQVKTEQDVEAVIKLFSQFQLLTPLRSGKYGIGTLNEKIEQQLNRFNFITLNQGPWYVGRPIMISSNDHAQQLFNGDIGILLPDINANDESDINSASNARVYFKMADGSLKSFLPSRLPAHDTVYAMTIHKSQGSEFDDILMVLPATWSSLLTKELIYTGITRAKKSVDLFSPVAVLQKATLSQTQRDSGLADALLKKI